MPYSTEIKMPLPPSGVERICLDRALSLYGGSIHDVAAHAAAITEKLHPGGIRTYVIERNINYTNVCCCRCSFCAFSVSAKSELGYLLTLDEIAAKIESLIDLGGEQILLQGGMHPDLTLAWYQQLLRGLKERFPRLHIHGFSPPEIIFLAAKHELGLAEVIECLHTAGLDSIPGGGAEILVDRVRAIVSPAKCSAEQWLDVMRQAHRLGLWSTATMMFGHVEAPEERIEHFDRLRRLQDESLAAREKTGAGGFFSAFTCWPFQPGNTRLAQSKHFVNPVLSQGGQGQLEPIISAGAYEYLKMTALSRICLDNFPNIQASWVTQGPRIAQLALRMGCNDLGSVMMEEHVVSAAGTSFNVNLQTMRQLIRDAGFSPLQRDYYYRPKE